MATRLAIAPAAWIGLISLVHGMRSMPVVPGTACLWTALYAKTGDLFAWICVAGVVVALGFGALESMPRQGQLLHTSQPAAASAK